MNVYIGPGNLNGKGLYASRNFKRGEIVIKYNLEPLSALEFEQLPDLEKMFVHSHKERLFLYSEPERYVNHSDTPNTYQDLENHCDIALRDIEKGEEITTDSSKDDIT